MKIDLKAGFILKALPGHAVEGTVMMQISVCSVVRSRYILNTMKNQSSNVCETVQIWFQMAFLETHQIMYCRFYTVIHMLIRVVVVAFQDHGQLLYA